MGRYIRIIACSVLDSELKAAAERAGVTIDEEYLEAGLHEQPHVLHSELQAAIDRAEELKNEGRNYDALVIGYGLCGRGTTGITAGSIPLIIPRVHDCIAMFLGSDKRYRKQFAGNPGTFYMTRGWYDYKTQPMAVKKRGDRPVEGNWDISAGFDSIKRKYGRDNAEEIYSFLNSWKKNYTRSVFIETGTEKSSEYEDYTRDLADELGWKFERVKGSDHLFLRMLKTELTDDEILVVPPGHITAFDPLKYGLYSYAPGSGSKKLWDRPVPGKGAPLNSGTENRDTEYSAGDAVDGVKSRVQGIGLGIDAGGTYTDAVIYDFESRKVIARAKSPTTRWNYTLGIVEAVKKLPPELLPQIIITVVSTTLATNAIVENAGQKVGLLLMPLGDATAKQISHSPYRKVKGRLSIQGDELEKVDAQQIRAAASELVKNDQVGAFAVSGYGSTVNPAHELQIKKIIEDETGLGVCCGHELSSTLNFFVRANTAVLNAGIIPLLEQFIKELQTALTELQISGSVMIVRGDGSLMSCARAVEHPIETTLSGPAASIAGARFLSGSADALVIDVGGTTSDIGLIKNGVIRLTEEGARVGRWKTHIKAVDMATLGTGGDSRIVIDSRELKTGPRRVAPVGRLFEISGHKDALEYISSLQYDYFVNTVPMEILALTGRKPEFEITKEETAIIDILSERPFSVMELSHRLNHGLWKILNTARLETSAVIMRYGLTPTDLLTASGDVNLWPAEISKQVLELYSEIWGTEPEVFTTDVFKSVTDNLLRTLVIQELDIPGDEAENLSGNATFRNLLSRLKGGSRALALTPSLKTDLIGVGAAAGWLLKGLAELLGSHLVIPEDADVANAVGAVCSMVSVRRDASVTPASGGGFLVNGTGELKQFDDYDEACDYLEEKLAEVIRTDAAAAGTAETGIKWSVENRISATSDGTSVFLGREYTVEITGLPV